MPDILQLHTHLALSLGEFGFTFSTRTSRCGLGATRSASKRNSSEYPCLFQIRYKAKYGSWEAP